MEKYYNDKNEVAVLYSPGYGAGWSSWHDDQSILFDKEIVKLVIDKNTQGVIDLMAKKNPDIYCGGAKDLKIAWLEKGTVFEINEYEGNESIHIIGGREYNVA